MKNKLAKTMKRIALLFVLGGLFLCPKSVFAGSGDSKETLELDLRNGYLVLGEENNSIWDNVLKPFRLDIEDYKGAMYDLDGDGTADLRISTCHTIEYNYRNVATPVFGGSICGDYDLKNSGKKLEYPEWGENGIEIKHELSSVVIHFPETPVKAYYSLSGTGVTFSRYVEMNGQRVEEEIKQATPGEEIYVLEAKRTGEYLKEWKTSGIPKDDLLEYGWTEDENGEVPTVALRSFIMPAQDVVLEPVYKKQQPYTIKVDGPNDYMVGDSEWMMSAVDCFLDSMWNSEFGKEWLSDWFDLDGDGIDDICIGPYKSSCSLSICLFSNLTSYTLTAPNDGPYWPVTLNWEEDKAFTVDPGAMYYEAVSNNNGKLLYQSLKPYETKDREGFFDLDQNGSADLRFDGRFFEYLATCSIKDTITIPAVQDGINHPVTFVVREIPKKSEYYKVTLTVENEGEVKLGNGDWTKIGNWYQEGDGISLVPEEGYELYKVKINDANVTLKVYEKTYYIVDVPNHDIEIRVWLKPVGGNDPGPLDDFYITVTVEGGWIDGPANVKAGDYVRIYPDCRSDGLYVSDWMVDGVMGWSYWEGELSFQVGDQDVYVTPNYRETKPLTIDLSDGAWDYTVDMLNCVYDATGYGPTNREWNIDLNGDGIKDISIVAAKMQMKPISKYSCGKSYTLTGGTRGPYYPITFVYDPKEKEPDVTGTPEPTGEVDGEQDETAEKKDDSSFHPVYFIISGCVLLCGGLTAFLLIRRKKRASKGEVQ
jgi:hypothetical protein